jgi:hypothetical protein
MITEGEPFDHQRDGGALLLRQGLSPFSPNVITLTSR